MDHKEMICEFAVPILIQEADKSGFAKIGWRCNMCEVISDRESERNANSSN
jgi:hypothetical protein